MQDGVGPTGDAADARVLERRVWRRIWLANLVGALPMGIYFVLSADQFDRKVDLGATALPAIIAVYLPAYVWSRFRSRQLFTPIASWVAARRTPDAAERRSTIDHPRRLALMSAWCWIWALAWTYLGATLFYRTTGLQYAAITESMAVSALIACSLTYLVSEDALRPLFAVVLAEGAEKPRTVGVMPRLALTWVIGSASYFIAVLVLTFAIPAPQNRFFIAGACVFALIVGATLTIAGSRSVARPLNLVRTALSRVERGDLETSVTIDDAGEIGQLQAGFNRMVTGLRERDRLKQLFSRHVGPDVAQRAVDAIGLGGVQLDATVVFVDVIGSTTLAAERPPESVVAMLNALFGAVIRAVGAEGGLVNQFQGDGALCVFGAPSELPDHAARALRAVSALRRDIVGLGEDYPGFDAAIGVSSGRVVGGDVGTEDRYEYTVIGDAANEASRLTDEAKHRPGRVLVSEHTVLAAGASAHEWLACGEFALRGRPTPTVVYEPA